MNKKVIGKVKDKTKGVPIVEFVGLKFNMYSGFYKLCKPYFRLNFRGITEIHVIFMCYVIYKNFWIL